MIEFVGTVERDDGVNVGYLAVDEQILDHQGPGQRRRDTRREVRVRFRFSLPAINDYHEGFLTAEALDLLEFGEFLYRGETLRFKRAEGPDAHRIYHSEFDGWD